MTVNLTGTTYIFTPVGAIPAPVQPPYVNVTASPVITKSGQTVVVTYTCDAGTDMIAASDLVASNITDVKGIYGEQKKT